MKTISKIMILAAAVLSAACAKEILPGTLSVNKAAPCPVSFKVSVEDGDKAALDGLNFTFAAGDSIYVYWKGGDAVFSTSESGSSVTFTGDLNARFNENPVGRKAYDGEQLYAVYPATLRCSHNFDTDVLSFDLPAAQTPANGSFDQNAAALFAKVGATSIAFKHMTSFVKMTISGSGIVLATLSANGSENLSGKNVNAGFTSAGVPASIAGGDANSIVVTPSGVSFEPGDYYINVIPSEVASGLSLELAKDGFVKAEKKSTNPVTFSRSELMKLGTVDADLEWQIPVVYTTDFTNSCPTLEDVTTNSWATSKANKEYNFVDVNANNNFYHAFYKFNSSSGGILKKSAGLHFRYFNKGSYLTLPALNGLSLKAVDLKKGSGSANSSSIYLYMPNEDTFAPGNEETLKKSFATDLMEFTFITSGATPATSYRLFNKNAKDDFYYASLTLYYYGKETATVQAVATPTYAGETVSAKMYFNLVTESSDVTYGFEKKESGASTFVPFGDGSAPALTKGAFTASASASLATGAVVRAWASIDGGTTKVYSAELTI